MTVRRLFGAASAVGILTAGALLGSAAMASAQEDDNKWVTFSASGSGDDEVPAGSGAEGTKLTGSIQLRADGEMIYTVKVTGNEEDITAGHIHNAPKGENGDVVVEFDPAALNDGTPTKIKIDAELAARIIKKPENYYINTHSATFKPPSGVGRGQLTADEEAPDLIDTGSGGQAADAAAGQDAALVGGSILVLASAAGGAMALRRRSGTDRA